MALGRKMMLSELVEALEAIRAREGDLIVRGTYEGVRTGIFAVYVDDENTVLLDVDYTTEHAPHESYRAKFERAK